MQDPRTLRRTDDALDGSEHVAPAGRRRRACAFIVDLCITIVLSQIAMVPMSMLFPPDRAGSAATAISLGTLVGFTYLGLAYQIWGNTLGKRLFSLAVQSSHERPVSTLRWLGRLTLYGLWPINAGLALWSSSRRTLCDRVASTRVVAVTPAPSIWLGLAGSLLVLVPAFWSANLALRLSLLNTEVWQVTKHHLVASNQDAPWLPDSYRIDNDSAVIDTRVHEGFQRVALSRASGQWVVVASHLVEQPGNGAGVKFGDAARH